MPDYYKYNLIIAIYISSENALIIDLNFFLTYTESYKSIYIPVF
jgi:hypothetical protein